MTTKANSRQRAIHTATRLFQRQGYHGTGLTQIISESASPKGSFYHNFPSGKEELALEAIQDMRVQVSVLFERASNNCASEPKYLRRVFRAVEQWLEHSEYLEGCPVAGFAIEGAQYPNIREACDETYSLWCQQLAAVLRTYGYESRLAVKRAHLIIAAIDGGVLMSRVAKDAAPLRRIGQALTSSR
jgi:AcrR family transcriptional regulator